MAYYVRPDPELKVRLWRDERKKSFVQKLRKMLCATSTHVIIVRRSIPRTGFKGRLPTCIKIRKKIDFFSGFDQIALTFFVFQYVFIIFLLRSELVLIRSFPGIYQHPASLKNIG